MKFYSDKLTERDIHEAAAKVPDVYVHSIDRIMRVRVKDRGWIVRLGNSVSNRFFNSGSYGASGERGAASYDDYGRVLSILFDKDPDARLGDYKGREEFHADTARRYLTVAA